MLRGQLVEGVRPGKQDTRLLLFTPKPRLNFLLEQLTVFTAYCLPLESMIVFLLCSQSSAFLSRA